MDRDAHHRVGTPRLASGLNAPAAAAGWQGLLNLRYWRDGPRTVALDRHEGPLRVLQRLYPEGEGICHHVLVHPPGGVAGGDVLELQADLAAGTHAVITTPGATRFYRSGGRLALQRSRLRLAPGAPAEWLPLAKTPDGLPRVAILLCTLHGRGRAVAIRSLQCISDSVNTSAHPEARGKTLETAKRAKRARGRMTHQPPQLRERSSRRIVGALLLLFEPPCPPLTPGMTAPSTTRLVPLNPGVTTAGATPGASAAALRAPGTPPLPPMPIVPGTAPGMYRPRALPSCSERGGAQNGATQLAASKPKSLV